jgi:hypothetical protein
MFRDEERDLIKASADSAQQAKLASALHVYFTSNQSVTMQPLSGCHILPCDLQPANHECSRKQHFCHIFQLLNSCYNSMFVSLLARDACFLEVRGSQIEALAQIKRNKP